jgi:hypothetical protein
MISGLKYVNAGALLSLFFVVYKTQKNIWSRDMQRNPRHKTHEPAVAKSYAGAQEMYVFTSISSKITPLKPTKGSRV